MSDGPHDSVLLRYHTPVGHYDELLAPERNDSPAFGISEIATQGAISQGANCRIRSEYLKLFDSNSSGLDGLARWKGAKQSLLDHPPASTGQRIKPGAPQAWELDPSTVVIGSQDFDELDEGTRQRTAWID